MPAKESLLFPLLFRLGRLLPFSWLKKASALPVIPLYHAVSDVPSPYVRHVGVWRSEEHFKASLAFLLKHFEPASLSELKAGKKTKKPPFHLTFDDGLAECYSTVFPLLKKQGVPATFFVNSAFVDNKDLFFRYQCSLIIDKIETDAEAGRAFQGWQKERGIREGWKPYLLSINYGRRELLAEAARRLGIDFSEQLKRQPCYMSLEELKSLEQAGFTIGAHSVDHPRYDELPPAQQLRQTTESLAFVRRHFNPPMGAFAFPFTDFGISQSFFDELEKTGACSLSFGCAGLKKEKIPGHLQRIPFDENHYSAQANLSKEYLYFLLKAPLRKNTFKR